MGWATFGQAGRSGPLKTDPIAPGHRASLSLNLAGQHDQTPGQPPTRILRGNADGLGYFTGLLAPLSVGFTGQQKDQNDKIETPNALESRGTQQLAAEPIESKAVTQAHKGRNAFDATEGSRTSLALDRTPSTTTTVPQGDGASFFYLPKITPQITRNPRNAVPLTVSQLRVS